jgi:tripartite ATP-independent transporter DctM subunit
MIVLVLFLLLFLFIFCGMPIAFAIGISGTIAILMEGYSLKLVVLQIISGSLSYTFSAIPLFIIAGDIMLEGKLTQYLVDFAEIFVGKIRGGLGHINILASIFFAGITGSATADTVALGSIEIPMMVKGGYDREYSTAITIASSVIGPIIPPSLTFIIYSIAVGGISIAGMFLAGLIPGLAMAIALMVANFYISKKRNYPIREYTLTWTVFWSTIKNAIIVLVMPVLIMVGIISGLYTPTEAAAVACLYAFLVSVFIFKSFKLSKLPQLLMNSAKMSAILLFILGVSNIFVWVIAMERVPSLIAEFLISITQSKYVFLIIFNLLFFVVGALIDTFPAIIIFAPIFAPIAVEYYQIDPIHFGIIFCLNLLVGLNTPPIGTGLFIGASVGKVSINKLVREVSPFVLAQIIVVLIVTYTPPLVVWLPRMFGF